MNCPFCHPERNAIFYEDELTMGLWDAFPVSDGHALIITKRHISSWFDTTDEEKLALNRSTEQAKLIIEKKYTPDGFNIGMNINEQGGQTIFHMHQHIIPRYIGDVPNPRGGVRNVIPGKGNYTPDTSQISKALKILPHERSLIRGQDDPLLPHFLGNLDRAKDVDILASFTLLSGVKLIFSHLQDLLSRGGRVRFLTGDYLGITDPIALRYLLDLDGDIELRVFHGSSISFHPKSYIFYFNDENVIAYIGSSNLSESALSRGIEWNYRLTSYSDPNGIKYSKDTFKDLYENSNSLPIDHKWIENYESRRTPMQTEVKPDDPETNPEPHTIQKEALKALNDTRKLGNTAGLVVLATGLGKTWLSAFDTQQIPNCNRILFVAHREEILNQSLLTYRRIYPNKSIGKFTGTDKDVAADILFASVQTISRKMNLNIFAREDFDYIVMDEFHHASARTYKKVLSYFTPKFLLGLTATPERTDGGDLLSLCQENLVYRCDMLEGIRKGLLSPFHYFGVPDDVDYSNIPWRSARFDEEALTNAVSTRARAQNALEQLKERGGDKTLAFCCSRRHADFMAGFFNGNGCRSVAVHSGDTSAPRAASLEQLESGELDVIFSVDMFNEGLDIPNINTVMMLRPTESSVLWLQQFGRGLRKKIGMYAEKKVLKVIDYIGNHRVFLNKPRSLFGLNEGDREIAFALEHLRERNEELPDGCEVTYDLKSIEIINSLLKVGTQNDAIEQFYKDFKERHGTRPTALEAFHEGYNPRALGYSSWFGFVSRMEDFEDDQQEVFSSNEEFFMALEKTKMTKSYKMLTVLAMLNEGCFPGAIKIAELTKSFIRIASRSSKYISDLSVDIADAQKMTKLIADNPVKAWVGARGTDGVKLFSLENDIFKTNFNVQDKHRDVFQEFTREMVEWRLAEYLTRPIHEETKFTCKVFHSNRSPILKLPSRENFSGLPFGPTRIFIEDEEHEADFVQIAINVIRKYDSPENIISSILRGWFGPDAGLPGTNFQVLVESVGDGYRMSPVKRDSVDPGLQLWSTYSRETIPGYFDLEFNTGSWNQGFVDKEENIFLLVTLDKGSLAKEHKYEDRFLSGSVFQWQSQNRTSQQSNHGQKIRFHAEKKINFQLFVRGGKLFNGKAAPFYYCGMVDFMDWEEEKPITVRWRLQNEVPKHLHNTLKIKS
jgi:superfamily II DNA or RNA helicase/diadenosine tetraphosphate (Ap4A) HIT family hydrolase